MPEFIARTTTLVYPEQAGNPANSSSWRGSMQTINRAIIDCLARKEKLVTHISDSHH